MIDFLVFYCLRNRSTLSQLCCCMALPTTFVGFHPCVDGFLLASVECSERRINSIVKLNVFLQYFLLIFLLLGQCNTQRYCILACSAEARQDASAGHSKSERVWSNPRSGGTVSPACVLYSRDTRRTHAGQGSSVFGGTHAGQGFLSLYAGHILSRVSRTCPAGVQRDKKSAGQVRDRRFCPAGRVSCVCDCIMIHSVVSENPSGM